jgi:hypothetical protein
MNINNIIEPNIRQNFEDLPFKIKLEVESICANKDIDSEDKVRSLFELKLSNEMISALLKISSEKIREALEVDNSNESIELIEKNVESTDENFFKNLEEESTKEIMQDNTTNLMKNEKKLSFKQNHTTKVNNNLFIDIKKELNDLDSSNMEKFANIESVLIALSESVKSLQNLHKESLLDFKKDINILSSDINQNFANKIKESLSNEIRNIYIENEKKLVNIKEEVINSIIKKQIDSQFDQKEQLSKVIDQALLESKNVRKIAKKESDLLKNNFMTESASMVSKIIKDIQSQHKAIYEKNNNDFEKFKNSIIEDIEKRKIQADDEIVYLKSQKDELMNKYNEEVLLLNNQLKEFKDEIFLSIKSYKEKKDLAKQKFNEYENELNHKKEKLLNNNNFFIAKIKKEHEEELIQLTEIFNKDKKDFKELKMKQLKEIKDITDKKIKEKNMQMQDVLSKKNELISKGNIYLKKLKDYYKKELEQLKNEHESNIKSEEEKYNSTLQNIKIKKEELINTTNSLLKKLDSTNN